MIKNAILQFFYMTNENMDSKMQVTNIFKLEVTNLKNKDGNS